MTESEHYVTVHVSTELLAKLREWSQPVQAQIQETPGYGTGYEMIFRVYEPTYTAAEVKVLTETATKLGRAIGRKEACDEAIDRLSELAQRIAPGNPHPVLGRDTVVRYLQEIASQPPQAASDATSGVPGHPEVSESRQAVRKRYPHAHACLTCSPDGRQPGPGCINCRQTGWDQTPCQAEGHKPQCPRDCCDLNAEVPETVRSPQAAAEPRKPLREALDDWPEPEGTFDEVLERAAQEREGNTP